MPLVPKQAAERLILSQAGFFFDVSGPLPPSASTSIVVSGSNSLLREDQTIFMGACLAGKVVVSDSATHGS